MPYDSDGNWIIPEGYEEYDMEEMFDLASSGPAGLQDLVVEMVPSFDTWGEAVYGEDTWGNLSSSDLEDAGTEYDYWSLAQVQNISAYITPYDPHKITQLRRGAKFDRAALTQKLVSESAIALNMAGGSGFAEGYQGVQQTQDLWSSYMTQGSEIAKSLSLGIYESKGDYLDDMYQTISEAWTAAMGEF